MAKIAVYDKFYKRYPEHDIITPALEDLSHEVIARAHRIRDAVGQILKFKDGDAKDRPDIVIIDGWLEEEFEYKKHPTAITEPCKIHKPRWYGTKEVDGLRTTFMLPQFEHGSDKYRFPTVESTHPHLPHGTAKQWDPIRLNLAGPVLSRMVETYLPETFRIGVSSDYMFDSVLHKSVLRGQEDAVQVMQDFVQHFGREADKRQNL